MAVTHQHVHSSLRVYLLLLTSAFSGVLAGCSGVIPDDPVATVTASLDRNVVPLGGPVTLAVQFVVSPELEPLAEDFRVMVHFLDSNGDMMWAADHEPSMPTSQWQPGQTISYTRRSRVPMYPYIGEAVVAVGLYSPATGERLALTGEPLGQRAYRATTVSLEPQAESSFVMYQDGWHNDELDPDDDLQWRWTTEQASLSFRNPGTDSVLYLELDGRPDLFQGGQNVQFWIGNELVYEIRLAGADREFHEIPVTVGQFGDGDTVTLALHIDKTFVPADVSGAESGDQRNLGVRVFYAFLEPQ